MKIEGRTTDYQIIYCTDRGTEKEINQDSALVMAADTVKGSVCMLMICDGMGGIAMGEYASGSVVRRFADWFQKIFPQRIKEGFSLKAIGREWSDMLTDMDRIFREYGKENHLKMGTTVTGMLFWRHHYLLVQSGDSRAYAIGRKVKQLSEDQSYVQTQIRLGMLTPEEARNHPKRSVLTDCIGGSRPSIPVCTYGRIRKNTAYLLCSDGFIHEINEEELLHMQSIRRIADPDQRQENLRNMVETVKLRGERDNISAIAVGIPNGCCRAQRAGNFFQLQESILLSEGNCVPREESIVTDSEG